MHVQTHTRKTWRSSIYALSKYQPQKLSISVQKDSMLGGFQEIYRMFLSGGNKLRKTNNSENFKEFFFFFFINEFPRSALVDREIGGDWGYEQTSWV